VAVVPSTAGDEDAGEDYEAVAEEPMHADAGPRKKRSLRRATQRGDDE
jgi:hypothetical protein